MEKEINGLKKKAPQNAKAQTIGAFENLWSAAVKQPYRRIAASLICV